MWSLYWLTLRALVCVHSYYLEDQPKSVLDTHTAVIMARFRAPRQPVGQTPGSTRRSGRWWLYGSASDYTPIIKAIRALM